MSLLDLPTRSRCCSGAPGEIDAIMVDACRGVDEEELTSRIAAVLPDGIEALTGTQITEETQ